MLQLPLHFSPHARSRVGQRGLAESQVRFVADHGPGMPEAAPAGAAPRTRHSARVGGRLITVVVAHEPRRRVVITAF
ncbi:DUF4258 domain-containing protein [Gemmatimonas sp.]|uniref:DUF4258 domain-containing protein n=1 Tax=Gemmatimonas sp. TaxID=1962908 RepID=UPI003DA2EFEC